uniref:hypothetical protein n=1 Tax=Cryobacterium sp. Y57 TaxID=2048287 RepID=UPI001E405BE2
KYGTLEPHESGPVFSWHKWPHFQLALTLLYRFRIDRQVDPFQAVTDIMAYPGQLALVTVALILIVTMITQTFSWGALRALQGTWRGWGPSALLRTALINHHVRRKEKLRQERLDIMRKAFTLARPRLVSSQIPQEVIEILKSLAGEESPPQGVSNENLKIALSMTWRSHCDTRQLAEVDSLLRREFQYPAKSRVMPTMLGNVLLATLDELQPNDFHMDVAAVKVDNRVPAALQVQLGMTRGRLGMFGTFVFIWALLAVSSPLILIGAVTDGVAIAAVFLLFLLLSLGSYKAAIASAEEYCMLLRRISWLQSSAH